MPNYRKIIDKLKDCVTRSRIIILIGSRQVGKTTLLEMIRPDLQMKVHYFTMERPDDLLVWSEGTKGLRQIGVLKENEKTGLLVDEFQYLQDPNRLFKEIYDSFPLVTIIASGSSSLEIQQKIKESLAGRKVTLPVYPLDFYEYLHFTRPEAVTSLGQVDLEGLRVWSKKISVREFQEDFAQFLLYGGLPRVALESDLEMKKIFLDEIITTYLQKDIKGILRDIEIAPFNHLLTLVASQVGNLLNVSELSNRLGLPRVQVSNYLEVLQGTFVNFLLKPYATNRRTEVVRTPKTYFYDNGIRNQILKLFSPLRLRPDAGALLENGVFMELKKNLSVSQDLSFWRTKNQTEVDFVLRLNERLYPVEVKLGSEKNIPPNVRSFSETHAVETAFILNATEWDTRKEGKTTYLWLPYFLAGRIPAWIRS